MAAVTRVRRHEVRAPRRTKPPVRGSERVARRGAPASFTVTSCRRRPAPSRARAPRRRWIRGGSCVLSTRVSSKSAMKGEGMVQEGRPASALVIARSISGRAYVTVKRACTLEGRNELKECKRPQLRTPSHLITHQGGEFEWVFRQLAARLGIRHRASGLIRDSPAPCLPRCCFPWRPRPVPHGSAFAVATLFPPKMIAGDLSLRDLMGRRPARTDSRCCESS
jgi:hypothetical protein